MAEFNFDKTIERDIDRLICEELYSSPEFLNLFLSKMEVKSGKLLSVEHSKWDNIEGSRSETDIEVRYENETGVHGILIEDKVSAPPQPGQAEGYRKRGDMHVSENRYVDYVTVLVAPAKYLENPSNRANDYDLSISHEELSEYFKAKDDKHNAFRYSCFNHSIVKQRNSARQLSVDLGSSKDEWFVKYVELMELSGFENLRIEVVKTPEGRIKPNWVHYNCSSENYFIEHKIHQGKVELHFRGCTYDDKEKIETIVNPIADSFDKIKGRYKIDREGNSDSRIVLVYDKFPRMKISDGSKANLNILRDNKDLFMSMFKIIDVMYEISERIKYIDLSK